MESIHEGWHGIAVLGAGSWGTAIANLLAGNGHAVTLFGRDLAQAQAMARTRSNERYLPGVALSPRLRITADLGEALNAEQEVLVCVPSHAFRELLEQLVPLRPGLSRIAWATKGFEPRTGRFLDLVVRDVFGPDISTAVLSGPSFAREVARALPSAVTLASRDAALAATLAQRLVNASFRVYTNDDMVGVQVCGGVKNVLAIAAGIADGLGFGANARAALVTRGLAELTRLGVALGGRTETFTGLAGLGDLLLTCTDDQSRNRRFGIALAAGATADEAQRGLAQVVEGRSNTREVLALASRAGVDMPICTQVGRVLFEGVSPRAAVHALMSRRLRSEIE